MVQIGKVEALMRYPVKSMLGESIKSSVITKHGLLGDRAYALIDQLSNKIVSAKNPKKWPNMFFYSAKYIFEPSVENLTDVKIVFPDNAYCNSNDKDINKILSSLLKHEVSLSSIVPENVQLEEYFADIDEIEQKNNIVDAHMPNGTFFDLGNIHLLTIATLEQFKIINPDSNFHINRFRPNIVIQTDKNQSGFIENSWIGKEIAIGEEVVLKINQACPRCVMTTLEQSSFTKDLNILKTILKNNNGNAGVYAEVIREGTIKVNDVIQIID